MASGKYEETCSPDASVPLKHGNSGDDAEIQTENNGEHDDNAGSDPGVVDGAVDDGNVDPEDVLPADGENPLNGDGSEEVRNDVTARDEYDGSDVGAAREAEFNVAGDAESDGVVAAAEKESEEVGGDEPLGEGIEESVEPSSELADAEVTETECGIDDVDAPSPMDVDASQPADAVEPRPDVGGFDDATMEVEFTGGIPENSEGGPEAAAKVGGESPMAEGGDGDDGAVEESGPAENVAEARDDEQLEGVDAAAAPQDGTTVADQPAAEYDEVDTVEPPTDHAGEVPETSRDAEVTANDEGLVEGADFTVELEPPDTSEQESTEVDQSGTEGDDGAKKMDELSATMAEESERMLGGNRSAEHGDGAAVSSDMVCVIFLSFISWSCIVHRQPAPDPGDHAPAANY